MRQKIIALSLSLALLACTLMSNPVLATSRREIIEPQNPFCIEYESVEFFDSLGNPIYISISGPAIRPFAKCEGKHYWKRVTANLIGLDGKIRTLWNEQCTGCGDLRYDPWRS